MSTTDAANLEGLLVVDKPVGWSSREAVDRAARWFPPRTPLGHTGTLDPLASGVLVLCVGRATRLAEYVQRMEKTYRTTLRLGARSDTDDAEGVIEETSGAIAPPLSQVQECVREFIGLIEQTPPRYSAVRVAGRRAYRLARRGKHVLPAPRQVLIHEITIVRHDYPTLEMEVRCGKGTYIRALARDLGERLGCGALVIALRRTRVGPFTCDDSAAWELHVDEVRRRLLPLAAAVSELPHVSLPDDLLRRLALGQSVAWEGASFWAGLPNGAAEAAALDAAGRLVAIVRPLPTDRCLAPAKVFV